MMLKIREKYEKFFNQKGQDLVEYALLLAIVVGIGYLIWNTAGLQNSINTIFSNAQTVTSLAADNATGAPGGNTSGNAGENAGKK